MKNFNILKSPWFIVLLIFAMLTTGGAVYQYAKAQGYQGELTNQYNRAFYELAESLSDIETSLEKGMVISNPAQMVRLSNEINKKTQSAKAALSQIPFEKTHTDQITKFLTQTGDFVYSLAMKFVNNKKIENKDFEIINNLISYSKKLNTAVENARTSILDGKMSVANIGLTSNIDTLDIGIEELEKQFIEYPALVYDGPFSSHVDSLQSKMLQDKEEISQEMAIDKAKWFLNSGVNPVEVTGEVGGNLPSYNITCYPEGKESKHTIMLDISKKGGIIIWHLDNREVKKAEFGINEAKVSASEFLNSKGFSKMTDSYYEVSNNIATINYAYVQNSVIMYSDLIKVKVALDTLEVIGMEAKGYVMSHEEERNLLKPKVSKEDILKKLPETLTVNEVEMAVIPTDSMEEIYCYEVKATVNDKNYLIYFDTRTGLETKILVLIETETGILTI